MDSRYDINNPMAPLWLMYPYIGRYSIGWRMGFGENYKTHFGEWFTALSAEDKCRFREMFPAPKGWLGWYEEPYTDEDFYDEEGNLLWNKDGMPAYSLEWLLERQQSRDQAAYLFFEEQSDNNSATAAEVTEVTEACLSLGWQAEFESETETYTSIGQYIAAEKERLFAEEGCNEEKWASKRYSVALNGILAKFLQNETLMQVLLQTENKVLAAINPRDPIWGIELPAGKEGIDRPQTWRGLNLLGFALMEVRDELRRVCQNYNRLDVHDLHERFG